MLSDTYSASTIAQRVKEIANAINRDYAGEKSIHGIVTMNGAFMFAADLIRQIKIPMVLHFAGSSSYFDAKAPGDLRINPQALPKSFGNASVLLIEDVMDSGTTINALRTMVAERFVGNIKIVTLLKRQGGKGEADYQCFTIPKGLFVVGYGLDLDGRFRELPDIKALSSGTASGIC